MPGESCPYPALPPPIHIPLTVIPEHPCPYIPGRLAESRAFAASNFPPELYHRFMDANFRRSGEIFYQPTCRGCRKCMQIRIPVEKFILSKSQRRCRNRNRDVSAAAGEPRASDEKYELYRRYIVGRHQTPGPDTRTGFETFLYNSPLHTIEMTYRDAAGKLLAVGICDVCRFSLSSVYFYFDPAESRRGLGTFGVLCEIDLARQRAVPFYYLGYWIENCPTMHYKCRFRPCQTLHADGQWREMP